jgi:hypothetical protein
MNRQQAKQILSLYRPGTADLNDPAFAEALLVCESDPESKLWFKAHCESYNALRARFKEIPVPEGFKEQILAERKIRTATFQPRRPVIYAAVAAAAALTVLTFVIVSLWWQPRVDTGQPSFRDWTVSTALLNNYGMALETNELSQIRKFLAQKKFDADFVVPEQLQNQARPTGCALLMFHGQRVSMICFHSGKPLGPGETSDLFLFVADSSDILETQARTPRLAKVSRATTASWSQDGKTYLLVAAGDENFLREYL